MKTWAPYPTCLLSYLSSATHWNPLFSLALLPFQFALFLTTTYCATSSSALDALPFEGEVCFFFFVSFFSSISLCSSLLFSLVFVFYASALLSLLCSFFSCSSLFFLSPIIFFLVLQSAASLLLCTYFILFLFQFIVI